MRIKTKPRAIRFLSPFLIMLLLIAPLVSFAETAGNFSVTNNGNQLLPAGSTGDVIFQFDLPAPATDTLLHDGAGYAVAAGDALSVFGGTVKFGDDDHDDDASDYSGTEIIVNSADTSITSAEVVTPGTADLLSNWAAGQNIRFGDEDHDDAADYDGNNVSEIIVDSADNDISAAEIVTPGVANLTAFPASMWYLETTPGNSIYGNGEDIVQLTHDGVNATADGDGVHTFNANDYYSDGDASSDYTDGEAIISSADANLDMTDTIVTTGMIRHVSSFGNPRISFDSTVGGAPYCIFDDVDTDGLVSNNDILVFDCGLALGDGHTMVCAGDAGCGDTLVVMGANRYYIEDNANATYDSGEMIWNDANTNGLLETGEVWQGFSSTALTSLSGSTTQFFNDGAGGNNVYDDGEDIYTVYYTGITNNVATGQVFRSFDAVELFSDNDNDGNYTVSSLTGPTELIARSVDNILASGEVITAGLVDVTLFTVGGNYKYSDADGDSLYTSGELIAESADANLAGAEIMLDGEVDITGFATAIRYHDGSGDTNYTDGEDIVNDVDGSKFYNADQLLSLKIGNPGTCLNTALAGLDIYEDTDGNNAFDGTETNIGTVAAAPFYGTDVDVSGSSSLYTSGSNTRTIFVTIDTAALDGSTVCTMTPIIPNTGGAPYAAQFLSGDNGPTDGNVATTDVTTIDLIAPTPTVGNITTTKTENAGGAAVANPTDVMTVAWNAAADGHTDIASVSANFSDFGGGTILMKDDGAGCDSTAFDNNWCAAYTVAAGTIDDTDNDVTITLATDTAGNVASDVTDDVQFSVDNQAPTGAISVTGATGTGGAFKLGNTPVPTWTTANTDIVSVSFTGTDFRAAEGLMAGTEAPAGTWTGTFTGPIDSQDDTNNNVSVTVTDDAGNVLVATGTNNYDVDTQLPSFTAVNTVEALKQDGAAPTLSTQLWYYYTGQNLRLQVNNASETDGNDLVAVKGCMRSMNEDTPAQTCTAGDFGNPANYQAFTITGPGSDSWTLNYALAGLGGWPSAVDGYQMNFQLEDDAGNVWQSANAAEFYIAVFNVIPQNIVPSLNNATTTDWSTITDFTNVPSGTIVFNAQDAGFVDIARMTFNAAMDLTDQATVTGLQGLAANVTTTDSVLRLDSSALAAFDIATQLMTKPAGGSQPGFVVKDDVGAVIGSIPATAGIADSYNFAGHGTASNFVWAAGPGTLTFDVTGFSSYESDLTPPTATINPTNGATGIFVDPAVVVTFSEAMNTGSFTYTLTPDPGGVAIAWSAGDTVATITHNPFANGTAYTFSITGGTDLAANAIAPSASTFTTIAASGGGGGGGGGGGSAAFGAASCSGAECTGGTTDTSGDLLEETSTTTEGTTTTPAGQFSDIVDHWAKTYIETAKTKGYVDGYPDNTFKPDQAINRAEAAKLIATWMMPSLAECTESAFSDVSCSDWFAKYVMYLKLMAVIEGYEDGTFKPGASITRAEALKMMLYAKGMSDLNVDGVENMFSDVAEGDWFYAAVLKGYSMGIISGYEDGSFGPNKPITRAEFTKIFVNTFLN